MRIEYEYEGANYTADVGVLGPEETLYALIGEQPIINNLGCGFISFVERDGNVDIYVSGYSSEGKTAIFNDNAIEAVTWYYPFLTPDMLELVPKESEVTIHSVLYATPDGMTYLDETPITLYSCSEVRIRNGVLIPAPPNPYPDVLPPPGTGAPGSGSDGSGGGDGGGDSGSDIIHEFVWVNTPMRSAVGSFEEATEELFTSTISERLETYRQNLVKENTGLYNTVVEPIGDIIVVVENSNSYNKYYEGPLSELTFDKIIQNRNRNPEFLYSDYTKKNVTGGYWYYLLNSLSFRFSVYFKISGNLYSDNTYKESGQILPFYSTVSPLWEIARTRAERQRWLDNYND